MSRVSRRRVLRECLIREVWVILVGRGNQGRGKSGNRVWGEMESNVRDVEKERGWSKGGHQAHAAMTATCVTQTAQHDGNALSHSPRIPHHTTHHKPSFLEGHPTTREREMSRPCSTLHLGHMRLRRGVVEDDDVSSAHSLPTSRDSDPNKNITPIPIRHFIPSTTTRHDTPVSSPVRPSKRIDPSHGAELIVLSRVVCRRNITRRVSKQVG